MEWSTPARPNGDIVSYTVHQRDPVHLSIISTAFHSEEREFSDRHTTLHGLAAYHRSVKADLNHSSHLGIFGAKFVGSAVCCMHRSKD